MGDSGESGWKENPVIIGETCQKFLGDRYWLCGKYFQRQGKRLHRAVWANRYAKRKTRIRECGAKASIKTRNKMYQRKAGGQF